MLSFLIPAALWASVALAVPAILHLWRPPPRTVRLGSLRFLDNAPRRLRNLRWRELWLLCLRVGLLACLVLLIAGPRWLQRPVTGPRHWALRDPNVALTGDALTHWREAANAGFEQRLLAPGFPEVNDQVTVKADVDLWSLLREADAELPPGSSLKIFSPLRIDTLRGTRPRHGHAQVEVYKTGDAADAALTWIDSVVPDASGEGAAVVVGRSDAHLTQYWVGAADAQPRFGDENWKLETSGVGNGLKVRLADAAGTASPTRAPWTPISVAPTLEVQIIHEPARAGDALYLSAAIQAAAHAHHRAVRLSMRLIENSAQAVPAADWLFWLSAQPLPENLASAHVFRDCAGEPTSLDARVIAPGTPVDGQAIWKIAPLALAPGAAQLWSDDTGRPLLTYLSTSAGERWSFGSRFDPAWNEIVRSTALPAWFSELLFAQRPGDNDRRVTDPTQVQPSETRAAAVATLSPPVTSPRDLHWPLWILAALCFVAERLLSARNPVRTRPTPITPSPRRAMAHSR